MRWAYRRLKTSREENLANHVAFVYAHCKIFLVHLTTSLRCSVGTHK